MENRGYTLTRPFHLSNSSNVTVHATVTRCVVLNKSIRQGCTRWLEIGHRPVFVSCVILRVIRNSLISRVRPYLMLLLNTTHRVVAACIAFGNSIDEIGELDYTPMLWKTLIVKWVWALPLLFSSGKTAILVPYTIIRNSRQYSIIPSFGYLSYHSSNEDVLLNSSVVSNSSLHYAISEESKG